MKPPFIDLLNPGRKNLTATAAEDIARSDALSCHRCRQRDPLVRPSGTPGLHADCEHTAYDAHHSTFYGGPPTVSWVYVPAYSAQSFPVRLLKPVKSGASPDFDRLVDIKHEDLSVSHIASLCRLLN